MRNIQTSNMQREWTNNMRLWFNKCESHPWCTNMRQVFVWRSAGDTRKGGHGGAECAAQGCCEPCAAWQVIPKPRHSAVRFIEAEVLRVFKQSICIMAEWLSCGVGVERRRKYYVTCLCHVRLRTSKLVFSNWFLLVPLPLPNPVVFPVLLWTKHSLSKNKVRGAGYIYFRCRKWNV